MDYRRLTRRLDLPPGFAGPERLESGDLVAHPLRRADLVEDLAAVNASVEVIRRTRGGWPDGPVSEEDDFLDLAWHEREFREATSFAYAVSRAGVYAGCFYLYPMGLRTELNAELLHHDVDASWWVTAAAYRQGLYASLYESLRGWLADAFPFQNVHYSNLVLPP